MNVRQNTNNNVQVVGTTFLSFSMTSLKKEFMIHKQPYV